MAGSSNLIRAARMFELYVRRAWPVHRRFVGHTLARRCRACALSERCSPLDADGVCRLCREAEGAAAPPAPIESDDELRAQMSEILKAHCGAGEGMHDAVVLFSGGKDSAYMVKRLQEEYPDLRLLALTYDNTFMSPIALRTIAELIPRLGVDHLTIRPRRELIKKLFRYGVTHLNAEGGYGTVDFSDGELLLDMARDTAAQRGIPLILCGYSRYQVLSGLGLRSFEAPREQELCDRTHVAGLPLADIFAPEELPLWWGASRHPAQRVARLLFPLFVWNLAETEVKAAVTSWGLVRRGYDSPIVTNHELIPVLGVVDVHKLGYGSFEPEFCRMIREGKADRQQWQGTFELLEHCARTGMFLRAAVEEGLAKLDLTLDDVGVRFG